MSYDYVQEDEEKNKSHDTVNTNKEKKTNEKILPKKRNKNIACTMLNVQKPKHNKKKFNV